MWNQFVDNEAAQIFKMIKTRPIIIAAHLKVVSYNGTSLATKTTSSFVINPDTSEAKALHSWSVLSESILEDIIKNKSYMASASSSAPPVIEDVGQIAKIETLLAKETDFWVKASMRVKNLNQRFWYMSCEQCNKITCAEYEEAYTCIYCKRKNAKAVPRPFCGNNGALR
ncbi:hypothetical protein Q3G72_018252 [Acer saccharum]|nr:hypothetical protein Q3G72_018252 [Acer saccharum]